VMRFSDRVSGIICSACTVFEPPDLCLIF
jgi:hypothetical protein